MLDPAILTHLEKAVAFNPIAPPAIERAWTAPQQLQRKELIGQFMDKAETDCLPWRQNLVSTAALISMSSRTITASDDQLAMLDTLLNQLVLQRREMHEEAARDLKRRQRFRTQVRLTDPAGAEYLWTQTMRMNRLQIENAKAIGTLETAVRGLRSSLDTRSGADLTAPDERLKPNRTTAAAIKDARAGKTSPVSFDDLRATFLAVD